ncbi:MAG: division/cell wall cluster transcriptional repressor MraZ [Deltaproteobacteria bacterium]|nr:MAG: division/cell wall cluster transcriptional repressor MraZ [Deltaproteobacteria bacterium]
MVKSGKRFIKMFRGSYEHTIDSKGRVSFPAQFRNILPKDNERLVITNYYPAHLWAFTFEDWNRLEQKLAAFPLTDPDTRSFKHFFVSGAHEVPIDKLGRILIPPRLREYAHLNKELVFVGQITHIEIWNKENWNSTFEASETNFEKVERKLADLGLKII